ncbi:DNA topoisomerase I, partial [Candidatus Woesearchaeota archaeon]|nr:DNA topoisomerase I [Candidatus Woesearchaeota archaeon]
MVELIITEKPSSARKVAAALADTKPVAKKFKSVPYFELKHKDKEIIVTSAVGHLYGLVEINKNGWTYPVFNIDWAPSYLNSKQDYGKDYIAAIEKLTKKADEFTIACDYDVEGEVIGLNVVRFACKKKDANRMKFSTLTKGDLVKSYETKMHHLDWGQAYAGETRHKLDWFYGINLSRALTASVKAAGSFKVMSAGRVQGPALKLLVDKEKEIQAFVPEPFWEISLNG